MSPLDDLQFRSHAAHSPVYSHSNLMDRKAQSEKDRLDRLVVSHGLAPSREVAVRTILAGGVLVDGAVVDKPAKLVLSDALIEIKQAAPYVSRSGEKLAAALDAFSLDPHGMIGLDVGCSTGGFTDCLLQRGAKRIYAIDVGYGLIDWRLRQDPRVVLVERTNIRYLEALPGAGSGELGVSTAAPAPSSPLPAPLAQCATIDVSFISLALVLPAVRRLITPGAWVVALVKPQFEAGAAQVGRGGVVRDPAVHAAVLRAALAS